MSLSDYESEKPNQLPEGWHRVTVDNVRSFRAKSGTRGINVDMSSSQGGCQATFWLTEKSLWRLNKFASRCGLTKQQRDDYDEFDDNAHEVLVGCRVDVLVEVTDTGYAEAVDYKEVVGGQPPPPVPAPPTGDEIPF